MLNCFAVILKMKYPIVQELRQNCGEFNCLVFSFEVEEDAFKFLGFFTALIFDCSNF
jgi:hypothetical protein